jgi:hypothetical protein
MTHFEASLGDMTVSTTIDVDTVTVPAIRSLASNKIHCNNFKGLAPVDNVSFLWL